MLNSISKLIDLLELNDFQKEILKHRYFYQVKLYDKKAKSAKILYLFLSFIITIGSIILPALLSIQQSDFSDNEKTNKEYRLKIYWASWSISLLITVSNGIIQLLSLNKQYLSFNTTREKLIAEGWHYLELSGDYEDETHNSSFNEFCEEIESIKKNQVDKELLFVNFKSLYNKKKKELNNNNQNNQKESSSEEDSDTESQNLLRINKKNVHVL